MELDLTYLHEMAGEDDTLVLEMIAIFEEQSNEYSDKMHYCLVNGNWKDLSRIAHKAKPSAAVVGLAELSKELALLEDLAREETDTQKYRPIVEKYESECKKAAQQLRKMFESA